ncbi:hypothetical protein ElyMa_001139200 [Elysia marginata]|uniref:DUF19 domain-containing protein n=1 Tax=Elysia marginata TaxID=1093978 RepID=A0AAV4HZB1_9GAST|nr:hypothetical protein ElyMa_001139200 [Elysia marginata]
MLVWSACIEAQGGNCTEERKKESLEECATKHLKALDSSHFFDAELDEAEIFYKDPYKFVLNSNLCNDTEEAASYVECSITVFKNCAETNSTDYMDAHTGPAKARKAVEKFCEGLKMILKNVNSTELQQCVVKEKPDTYKCVYEEVMKDEEKVAKDVCTQYEVYSTCMSNLDKCGGDEGEQVALFSKWAEHMTPEKCPGPNNDAAGSIVTSVWVFLAAALFSLVAHW